MKKWTGTLLLLLLIGSSVPAGADEGGKKLFGAKCSICHGKDGKPKKAAGKAHNFQDSEWQKKITIEEIQRIILEGREGEVKKMPPFKEKLSPDEIKLVASYVKTLSASKN